MGNPVSPMEKQECVDCAAICLFLFRGESKWTLLTGVTTLIDKQRCINIIQQGAAEGYTPSFIDEDMLQKILDLGPSP